MRGFVFHKLTVQAALNEYRSVLVTFICLRHVHNMCKQVKESGKPIKVGSTVNSQQEDAIGARLNERVQAARWLSG